MNATVRLRDMAAGRQFVDRESPDAPTGTTGNCATETVGGSDRVLELLVLNEGTPLLHSGS